MRLSSPLSMTEYFNACCSKLQSHFYSDWFLLSFRSIKIIIVFFGFCSLYGISQIKTCQLKEHQQKLPLFCILVYEIYLGLDLKLSPYNFNVSMFCYRYTYSFIFILSASIYWKPLRHLGSQWWTSLTKLFFLRNLCTNLGC